MTQSTKPMKEKAVRTSFGGRYIVGVIDKNNGMGALELISGPRVEQGLNVERPQCCASLCTSQQSTNMGRLFGFPKRN
jgi:hypothetical protein